jgi:hypothetical protein
MLLCKAVSKAIFTSMRMDNKHLSIFAVFVVEGSLTQPIALGASVAEQLSQKVPDILNPLRLNSV